MAVFKIEKNKNYTTMSNYHLRDKTLSFRAKGLLSFMLSLPEDWDYSINGLVSVSIENTRAIRTILKELEKHKYLVRERYQDRLGRFQYNYLIYEIPYVNFPHTDEPHANNDLQINTNITNTNNKDKLDKTLNPIIKELVKRNFIEITDLEIYRYDNLFNELLEEYEYKQVIIATSYVLSRWKENNGLDENELPIENKYKYFETAVKNNLTKLNEDIDLDWGI